uniref:Dihydrolipoyllysine-residue succinyltransferase component of 2-oxoglutarate dehydrogenase complex, mitochondrial n=1 Tax=Glossina brevipalpis TaxID=37001 RepID=A0A1A9W3I2_9MUSC
MSSLISIATRRLPRNVLYLGMQTARSHEIKAASLVRRWSRLVENLWTSTSDLVVINGSFSSCGMQHIHTSAGLWNKQTVNVPPFPESVSEGDIKFTTKVGDQVSVDQVVMEVETDKTAVPVPAPFSGVIREILVKDGDSVKSGQGLFVLEQVAGGAPPPKPAAAPTPKPAAPAAAPPAKTAVSKPPVAPSPPPAAAPPPRPVASGPPPPPAKPIAPAAAIPRAQAAQVKVPPADYTRAITGTRTEQRVKMNRMRQKIAARLKEAQNVNAMLTTFNEIDMSVAMQFRKFNLEAFTKKYGIKIGFMSIFTKASAYALQDQPVVNAVIEGNEIVYRDYVDISVAVATPKGLVVPVIRNVEGMNYADIEIAMAALGEKARKGAITVEDMDGGTFTISNGGVFGSLMGTPIINPPQSAILGMHGIFERPIAVNGQVVIRPMMYIALTYDHRLIDGREAVMFLRKIKAAVEDPKIMLAGL